MALTMTRTRTQTTLSRLALKVAEAHGELTYLEELLCSEGAAAGQASSEAFSEAERGALEQRRVAVMSARDALYVVIRQFDPELDPAQIGAVDSWKGPLKRFRNAKSLRRTYLAQCAELRDRLEGS